jgi:hypothetical protein
MRRPWIAPDVMSPPYSGKAWPALQAWKANAFSISRDVFSVVERWPAWVPGARCTAAAVP